MTHLRLLPLLIPFVLLFLGGLALTVAQSLGVGLPLPVPALRADPLAAYAAVLGDAAFWESFGFSLYVSFTAALGSVGLGAVLAYGIWNLPGRLQGPAVIYKVALVLPHVAIAFIVLVLLSQSGWVASLAHALGFIRQPADFPALLFAGNGLGLVAAYVFKGAGFSILMCLALLKRLDPRLITTARMLGAGRAGAFFRIVVPHLAPAMSASFLILFLYGFGAFDIPFLLSESSPGMLSIRVYSLFFERDLTQRPQAMAMLVVMLAFSAVFIVLYTLAARRLKGARKL